ncbi:ABC transporter permease [Clostridium sp. Sa3CUN1]|uniref:ABC transporter permease n=1 Tax=Clostridium gallinarum TaxID=2762246 RepID=A0ABR8Q7H3_9CLOT|nr:ABC transporter permease [Clostridium gallinarum]MBD7916224.1 ABC transporter permease [Clostridium gallinarum]
MIIVSSVISLTNKIYNRNLIYPNNTVSFYINRKTDKILLKDVLNNIDIKDNTFLSVSIDIDNYNTLTIDGIFNGEKSDFNLNLSSGRLISYNEYLNKDKVVIVKDNIINQLKKVNNNYFFIYNDEEYNVVGFLDSKKSSYNKDIYINLSAIVDNNKFSQSADNYFYTYCNDDETDRSIANFNKALYGKFGKAELTANPIVSNKNPLIESLAVHARVISMLIIVCLVLLITILNINMYWIDSEQYELGIRRLIGASSIDVILLLIKRYIISLFSSSIFALITFEYLKYTSLLNEFAIENNSIATDIKSIIIVVLISTLFSTICLIVPVNKVLKLNIHQNIKGARL